jgi:adenylylsulfate kinase
MKSSIVPSITAAISPYRKFGDQARAEIVNFVEMHVDCPLEVCVQRDVKGLYAKAMRGEIANFTGISDPYEPPIRPDGVVQTDRESPEESLKKILECLAAQNYIPYRQVVLHGDGTTGM